MSTHFCKYSFNGLKNKHFSFSDIYGIENRTTKSTLNIVSKPFQDAVVADTEQFTKESWLFQFKFQMDYLDTFALSSINDYFSNFLKINLMSQIYVWAESTKESRLFEVYRIYFGNNLTIAELCQVIGNNDDAKVVITNGNQIWARRNNMTGAHLKVAYMPAIGYLYKENNVITV
jgi:hypothetical protein